MPLGNADAQISAVERISEPSSVLDVVLSKADMKRYDAANPFVLRVVLCGKKKSGSLAGAIEKLVEEAKKISDAANPFYEAGSTSSLSSFIIDYGDYFVGVVEGAESYVFRLSERLRTLSAVEGSSVRVLYLEDDVSQPCCAGVVFIDKVPPSSLTVGSSEKSADELVDAVVHDITSVVELSTLATNQGTRMKSVFVDNAKVNHPKLFPKVELLMAYMKSDNFFTLDEFIANFCKPAHLVRDVEINHPAEDPLSY